MKVLVVGNGGREHAIAWKLLQSPKVEKVFCIPGNGGTATLPGCQNMSLQVDDFEGIATIASVQGVALVVVGPEAPLAGGIVDYLRYRHGHIPVFGPTKEGAQIESSKLWAKEIMHRAGVRTAKAVEFTELEAALNYLEQQPLPIVIKADGLAAGKGVTVATTLPEAVEAIQALFKQRFTKILIEEFVTGKEVSILALTDGSIVRPLLPACDHKRIGEGDTGENTGGMGVYTPAPWVTPELMAKIEAEVLQPTVNTLREQGIIYQGVLYAGLMITEAGEPLVLEFNCRFGDPETQAILPLLETPLVDLLIACTEGNLGKFPVLDWLPGSAVCVVAAAAGYPGKFQRGDEINGLLEAKEKGVQVFQAGTILNHQKKLLTDGGRVLSVTGLGVDLAEAIEQAYAGMAVINFPGMYYRRDIAGRVIPPEVGDPQDITPSDLESNLEPELDAPEAPLQAEPLPENAQQTDLT